MPSTDWADRSRGPGWLLSLAGRSPAGLAAALAAREERAADRGVCAAGMSDNAAHWRLYIEGRGGTLTALDETATELIDPDVRRPLRPLISVDDPAGPDHTSARPDQVRTMG